MKILLIDLVYFTLFIPLMMMPILGWGILIAIGNYKERLEA